MKRWVLGLILLLTAGCCWGQTLYRIAGRVVSKADGRALAGATVTISVVQGGRVVASMVSGEDGGFAFEGVKVGKYSLSGAAQGYLSASYDEHEQFSSAIVTGVAGLDTESLVLKLVRAATISGRVIDEAGDGVRGAQVTLYGAQRGGGTNRVGRVMNAQTDDRGEYEMSPLAPGNYFLSAQATPWYAVHASGLKQPGAEYGVTGKVDPALDVAYPLTFYAGATTSDEATPIPVKGGEEMSIDLHVVPQPALRLTLPGGRGGAMLMRKVFDEEDGVPTMTNGSAEEMEIAGVLPGRYELRQFGRTGMAGKTATVDITRSQSLDLAAEEAGGAVKVKVAMEGGGKLSAGIMVGLARAGAGFNMTATVPVNEAGEAEFPEVQPGVYRPHVFGNGSMHVVGSGEVKVTAGGTTTATLVASQAMGSVEGFATLAEKGVSGAMVVLAPLDRPGEVELYRRDQSDLDGSFVLGNVVPGRYAVVAIQGGWGIEWGKPDVLARYLGKAAVVTVTGVGKGPVKVGAVVVRER